MSPATDDVLTALFGLLAAIPVITILGIGMIYIRAALARIGEDTPAIVPNAKPGTFTHTFLGGERSDRTSPIKDNKQTLVATTVALLAGLTAMTCVLKSGSPIRVTNFEFQTALTIWHAGALAALLIYIIAVARANIASQIERSLADALESEETRIREN